MIAQITRRRIAAANTQNEREEAVRDMLREIAYVLHVTRKVSREIAWPVTNAPVEATNDAEAVGSATAV